jgi:hypothetical protein
MNFITVNNSIKWVESLLAEHCLLLLLLLTVLTLPARWF